MWFHDTFKPSIVESSFSKESSILITGGRGFLGKSLELLLKDRGYNNIYSLSSKECDLRDSASTDRVFQEVRPDVVFHLAASNYGLYGNQANCYDVMRDNLKMSSNVIDSSIKTSAKKIIVSGSACIYPEKKGIPELKEAMIFEGVPHEAQYSYAYSKLSVLLLLESAYRQYGLEYAYGVLGNIYGPYFKDDINKNGVIPALITKFAKASESEPVTAFGTGAAIRDFSYSSDVAEALFFLMLNVHGTVNVGSGKETSIKEIVSILQKITGKSVVWDTTKGDGELRRCIDVSFLLKHGYKPQVKIEDGIAMTYDWFIKQRK